MMQVSMFSGTEPLKITKKIRLIETFAGIGSQAKALKNIGADFEHYRICEFDKYAVTAYNAIHGTDFPVSDITKWTAADMGIEEKDKYEYIMTYSFPCTDISLAGKQVGMAKDSGTRSGLLWEVERILEECDGNLPQVLLMENVDAILFEKNRKHFFQWCNKLEELGYKNYYEVLNAKDYGIPQNRNRCFMVSILGDYYYEFPKPVKLELCVKDMLEKEVPEKYYISAETVKKLLSKEFDGKTGTLPDGIKQLGNISNSDSFGGNPQTGRVYDPEYICPAINTMGGGQREPKFLVADGIAIKTNNEKGYDIAQDGDTINLEQPNSKTRRGRVGKQIAQTRMTSTEQVVVEKEIIIYDDYNSCIKSDQSARGTLTLNCGSPTPRNGVKIIEQDKAFCTVQDQISFAIRAGNAMDSGVVIKDNEGFRIRKLMPIECYKLQGFTREDFFKVKQVGISDCQCYKQAGNSIVVDVLEAIFRNMNIKGVKRWND